MSETMRSISGSFAEVGQAMGKKFAWTVINLGFWALPVVWLFAGQQWAWNLFRFLTVALCFVWAIYFFVSLGVESDPDRLEDLIGDVNEGPSRTVSLGTLNAVYWTGILFLAAFGYFFWAAVIAFGIVMVSIGRGKIDRTWEEEYGG